MNHTRCNYAWDYLMYYPQQESYTYCCRTSPKKITSQQLEELGSEVFGNESSIINRRLALLNNEQHSECNTCWKLENSGFLSARSWQHFDQYMNRNNETSPRSNYTNMIEIVLGNLCDSRCIYCNEDYSSQWASEKIRHNIPIISNNSYDHNNPTLDEHFWDYYESVARHHVLRFGFIGGEPLITDRLYTYLDRLLDIHTRYPRIIPVTNILNGVSTTRIEICITTNLNTSLNYLNKFLDYSTRLIKHFDIIVQVSGENTGAKLEYIRSGTRWDRWLSNLIKLSNHDSVKINFMPCINLLGLSGLADYMFLFKDWCNQYYATDIHRNIVTDPWQQSPRNAPREFIEYFNEPIAIIESMISNPKYKLANSLNNWVVFLDFLKQTQSSISKNPKLNDMSEMAQQIIQHYLELDQRRHTNVFDIFPEFLRFNH